MTRVIAFVLSILLLFPLLLIGAAAEGGSDTITANPGDTLTKPTEAPEGTYLKYLPILHPSRVPNANVDNRRP